VPSWLFMIYGGLVADRVPRRTMMVITQTSMMLLAFILAGLVFLNVVQPWHILVLAFLLGVCNAFDTPARQSLVVELVEREDMSNAIAFNGTIFSAGLIIGPAIGAAIYALTGPGWCFVINGVSFLAVIGALLMMHIKPAPIPIFKGSVFSAIGEGLRYVRGHRLILTLVTTVFVVNIIGFGPITLLPAWAVSVLHGDVTTNGLLLSARGIGAVIGGLVIAAVVSRRGRGKWWAVSSLVMPMGMIAFSLTRDLTLSLFLMAISGFTMVTMMNNSNAMVQSHVPDDLRGRVMGFYSLMFMGGGPLGSLLAGTLADRTSPVFTFISCAVVMLIYASIIWFLRPEIRKVD
jgi:MFS family permease